MNSQEMRRLRDNFWKQKEHAYLAEANLITPAQDATSLFNTSGMQQLIPYLAGKPHSSGKRLYNIQKCLRTVDIDEVGDRSHLTVFEMMGNWSLGDYFKKESVANSWEFLTKYLKLDPAKLAVTCFAGDANAPKDEETAGYWQEIGMPAEKISFLGAEDNWRSPGPVGPCGPDTEIFYRVGDRNGGPALPPAGSNVATDEDNWMEIWNNVFMQYYRDESGTMTKLAQQNVDTGMGFERMCCVLQDKNTVFETDVFASVIALIEQYTGLNYQGNERRMRIITDHLRSAAFMVQDGAIASNVGTGYILRMLIRRMYYNLMLLKELPAADTDALIKASLASFAQINAHRKLDLATIEKAILAEVHTFKKTISNGLKILQDKMSSASDKVISGKDAFTLYDTYGFPLELTKEIAADKGFTLDEDAFEKEMEQARQRSRSGSQQMFDKGIDRSKYLSGVAETKFIGYEQMDSEMKLLKDLDIEGQRVLIFDATPFYAESGGQAGDIGVIIDDDGKELRITDVKKYEGVFLHFVG